MAASDTEDVVPNEGTRRVTFLPVTGKEPSPAKDPHQPAQFLLPRAPYLGLADIGAIKPNRRPGVARTHAPRISRFSAQHLEDLSVYLGTNTHYPPSTNTQDESLEMGDMDGENMDMDEMEPGEIIEKKLTAMATKDLDLVTWEMNDPECPKNWTMKQKWAATFVISGFTFISPVSSSMVAPALSSISLQFHITDAVAQQLIMSVFIIGYAIGPLLLGPLSEIYGRVPVLQGANFWFLVANTVCGFTESSGQLIAFRFLAGLGGSAPLALGGGVISDIWKAEERGRAISLYSLAPLLGPALGPIAGGFIAENVTWRWAFWAVSIVDTAILFAGLFFLRETYSPKLLHVKAQKLRKLTGNENLHTMFESPDRSAANTLKRSLIRPFKLLFTQPIVQVLAIYLAYLYGLIYLVLSTFPSLWEIRYGESIGIGGLNYISLGIGFLLGAQISANFNDRIYRHLKARNNDAGIPEFRVPLMYVGSALVPCGLLIYGWTAQYRTHWIFPNIGAAMFSAGIILGSQCIQTYLVDAYTMYAASAVGAAVVLRSIAGFSFPLFAVSLYTALGYGWGNSVLALCAVVLGVPAPLLIQKYGQRLRERSPYAAGGDN